MTINFKNAMSKIKEAKNEFVTGFKSGYKEVREERVVPTTTESTVSTKTGKKLGVVIAMIAKFFKNPTTRIILKVLGISAATVSALLNLILVFHPMNFFFVVLPLLMMATTGTLSLFGEAPEWLLFPFSFSTCIIACLAIMGILSWIVIGNMPMLMVCVALYALPHLVWIDTVN